MKPIYYVIFAINGFKCLIWICMLIRLLVIRISADKNSFCDGMIETRYTFKLKGGNFTVSKDRVKENSTSESKRIGFQDDRGN